MSCSPERFASTRGARATLTLAHQFNPVGALAWNDHVLTSGSHDRLIYHRDVRIKDHWTHKLAVHRQEVCGLKWSDDNQLASGGNDNKLFVFDKMSEVSGLLWLFARARQNGRLTSFLGARCE